MVCGCESDVLWSVVGGLMYCGQWLWVLCIVVSGYQSYVLWSVVEDLRHCGLMYYGLWLRV